MPAQHKRPGRTAWEERIRRAREREYRKQVAVLLPRGRRQRDGFPGRIVAIGVPPEPEMEEIA